MCICVIYTHSSNIYIYTKIENVFLSFSKGHNLQSINSANSSCHLGLLPFPIDGVFMCNRQRVGFKSNSQKSPVVILFQPCNWI